ncbi:MAG: hypothetical protein ACFHX7_23465 [Pseudomonadota bacterium]
MMFLRLRQMRNTMLMRALKPGKLARPEADTGPSAVVVPFPAAKARAQEDKPLDRSARFGKGN